MMSGRFCLDVVDFESVSRPAELTLSPERRAEQLSRCSIRGAAGGSSNLHSVSPVLLHGNMHDVARRRERIAASVHALDEIKVTDGETRSNEVGPSEVNDKSLTHTQGVALPHIPKRRRSPGVRPHKRSGGDIRHDRHRDTSGDSREADERGSRHAVLIDRRRLEENTLVGNDRTELRRISSRGHVSDHRVASVNSRLPECFHEVDTA